MADTQDRYLQVSADGRVENGVEEAATVRGWSKKEQRLGYVAGTCLVILSFVAISTSTAASRGASPEDTTSLSALTATRTAVQKNVLPFTAGSAISGYRPQAYSETQAGGYVAPWAGSRPLISHSPSQNFRAGFGRNSVRVMASAKLGEIYQKLEKARPVQIIPSVLPADWAAMGQCVKDLEAAGVDRIQFDVMDGNFVPNLTFGPEMIAACRKYCKTPFETQLMVTNYNSDTMLEEYVAATKGPNGEPGVVIVHVEACIHLHRTLAKIRQLGGSPSVALNPHTPMEMVKNVLDMVDHVLVMTVNPGFGGQAYIPTMVNKIQELKKAIDEGGYDVDIEVDGGVKADWTISQCAAAGANCFIAGSGMFAYPTLKEGCDALRKVAVDAQAGNVLPPP